MTLKTIRFALLVLGLVVTTYVWPLRVLTGWKVAYVVLGGILVLVALASIKKRGPPGMYIYAASVACVGILHLVVLGQSEYFWMSLATYLVVPVICGRPVLTPQEFDRLLLVLSVVAIPNLIGLVLQVYGYSSEFLTDELTRTGSDVHTRYTSILGGALALGIVSTVTALSSAYWLIVRRQYLIFNGLVFASSLIGLFLSFARRDYLVLMLGLFLIYWGASESRVGRRRGLFIACLLMVTAVLVSSVFYGLGSIVERVASLVFFLEEGDGLRLIKWIETLSTISQYPLLGVGFGSSGTIGRDPSDFDIYTDLSAESYYLQMILEGGIFHGGLVLFIIGQAVVRLLKNMRRSPQTLLATTIFVCFAFESIAGTAVISPFMSVIFWLAFGTSCSPPTARNVRDQSKIKSVGPLPLMSKGNPTVGIAGAH